MYISFKAFLNLFVVFIVLHWIDYQITCFWVLRLFCLTTAIAFSNSFIVFFDFRFSVWLLHDLYLSVKLFVFFLVCFPDFVKWSFWVFFLVHWTSFKQLFLIFSKQITDSLFFFWVDYWTNIVFLWWCHVSLVYYIFRSLVLLTLHLNK